MDFDSFTPAELADFDVWHTARMTEWESADA